MLRVHLPDPVYQYAHRVSSSEAEKADPTVEEGTKLV